MSDLHMISQFLKDTPMCFVATISGNAPKVRPFQYQFDQDGKLWFCTARSKEVFQQLQANPATQLCAVKPDATTLRVDAKVVFEDNLEVKKRILEEQPLIKSIYGSADNPDFTTFYVDHGVWLMFDFSGNPPRTGTF